MSANCLLDEFLSWGAAGRYSAKRCVEDGCRRQFVRRIAGAEVLVGWRSGTDQAATEGPHVPPTSPRDASDRPSEPQREAECRPAGTVRLTASAKAMAVRRSFTQRRKPDTTYDYT